MLAHWTRDSGLLQLLLRLSSKLDGSPNAFPPFATWHPHTKNLLGSWRTLGRHRPPSCVRAGNTAWSVLLSSREATVVHAHCGSWMGATRSQRGRTTSKVRRVWVITGISWAKNPYPIPSVQRHRAFLSGGVCSVQAVPQAMCQRIVSVMGVGTDQYVPRCMARALPHETLVLWACRGLFFR